MASRDSGRGDFGGIDNEALDFSQLEDYINDDNIYFHEALVNSDLRFTESPSSSGKPHPIQSCSSPLPSSVASTTPSAGGSEGSCTPSPGLGAVPTPSSLSLQVTEAYSCGAGTPSSATDTNTSTTTTITTLYPPSSVVAVSQPSFPQPHHLPDSPPDSGSEPPFSPPNDEQKLSRGSRTPQPDMMMQSDSLKHFMSYNSMQPLKHLSPEASLTITPPHQHSPQQSGQGPLPAHSGGQPLSLHGPVGSNQVLTQLSQPMPNSLSGGLGLPPQPSPHSPLVPPMGGHLTNLYGSDEFLCESLSSPGSNPNKKRKLSDSPKNTVNSSLLNGMVHIKQEPGGLSPDPPSSQGVLAPTDDEYSFDFSGPDASGMFLDTAYQCIRFQPFQQNTWHVLCDHSLKELPPPNYRVDADKGFNFSNADDAFVCQKKNHFQVTVHVQPVGEPQYVKMPEGIQKVDNFFLHFHGVKVESPSQTIKVEQSQSDRSKKPFHPVPIDLNPDQVSKTTVGRLHFSETTSNNMRKKGKPNPDQRYFYLVVGLYAHIGDQTYPIIAHSSERIIVRASNPGQFENDMELSWQRGHTPDSIYHAGRVGVNTDRPDESLVVHGNIKVTGHIIQPSDSRAKTNVKELDTKEQLKNVSSMRIVRYQYNRDFAKHAGLSDSELLDTGVIAQEVQQILPEAVQEAGDILLPSGQRIENFLVVNKERIFMENVGAVKELCKVTDNLETRIDELERMNRKLTKLKRLDSIKSSSSISTVMSCGQASSAAASRKKSYHYHIRRCRDEPPVCTNRFVQAAIVVLVLVMAFCLIAMALLYILEWQKRHIAVPSLGTNHGVYMGNASTTTEPSKHQNSLNDTNLIHRHGNFSKGSPASQHNLSAPTSIPILKPKLIGAPSSCRDVHVVPPSCVVYCCGTSDSSRLHQDDAMEGDGFDRTQTEPTPIQALNASHTLGRSSGEGRSMNLSDFEDAVRQHPPQRNTGSSEHNGIPAESTLQPDAFGRVGKDIPQDDSDHLGGDRGSIEVVQDNSASAVPTLKSHRASSDNGSELDRPDGGSSHHRSYAAEEMVQQMRATVNRNRDSWDAATSGRAKRETGESRGQLLKSQLKKDLPRSVDSLKLMELNATIGQEYCNTLQCVHGTGPRFSYHIPVSKYMGLEYITLQFNLNLPLIADHCVPDHKPLACPVHYHGPVDLPLPYNKEFHLTEELSPTWRLPVGLYLWSAYRFRILARGVITDAPCSLPDSEAGRSFIEYLLVFQRKCDK